MKGWPKHVVDALLFLGFGPVTVAGAYHYFSHPAGVCVVHRLPGMGILPGAYEVNSERVRLIVGEDNNDLEGRLLAAILRALP